MTSRLIVKNIPKNIDEQKLKKHFEKFGDVTDVKIIFTKKNVNRRLCFIGYKSAKAGKEAQAYFNNTYIQASKISVDFAKLKDEMIKTDKGKSISKSQIEDLKKQKTEKSNDQKKDQGSNKEEKFKEFLDLMKSGSTGNMSWNDVLYQKQQKGKKGKKQQQKEEQKQQEKVQTNLEELEQQMESQKQEGKKKKKSAQIEEEEEGVQSEQKKQKKEGKEGKGEENDEIETETEKKIDSKRLYVVNLPYKIDEEEVRELFQQYGNITELKIPKNKETNQTRGFCFVQYELEEEALRCFSELDNQVIFGRILHVRPSYAQPKNEKEEANKAKQKEFEENEVDREKSSYKKLKKVQMRRKLDDQTNWNTLFLNPNSILEAISSQYNVKKSDILSAEADDLAVRTAHAETQVIKETKEWMLGQGLNLDFLDEERQSCKRSETIILVKNLPYEISQEKLIDIFDHYGVTDKVLLSPNKSIGIVEYINKADAENAFKQLSYHIIKHNPMYLEWAPFDLIESEKKEQSNENTEEKIDEQMKQEGALSTILYVKNLNFDTTDNSLQNHFEKANVGDIKSVKIVRKQGLSCGYGFVEFANEEGVKLSLKKVQRSKLDDHVLQLSVSKQKQKVEPKKQKKQKQNFEVSSKIVVRNLAFEATKKDIKNLFKNYGEIKVVRLPQKINGQHRGFAFVEFVSTEEAKNAVSSLSSTHLYGRKLVIEYAKQDFSDQ